MAFSQEDIRLIKNVVGEALATLQEQEREPLSQQVAWHGIPRAKRRAAYDAHAMQETLSKQYAVE